LTEQVDILVVGGGIHGVGVAQAAAAAGHSVLLVEKSRLAAGTSSRSSKLIHGGLRYLETYQFRLVRECLRERRILLDVAPDLVRLEPFHLPVYEGARRAPWLLTVGLGLYTALAGFGRGTGFSRVDPGEFAAVDGLRPDGLRAVLRYYDARTDDRLLTRAVMASAISVGARLWDQAECVGATLTGTGAVTRIRLADRQREVECRVLINAAGPWAAQLHGDLVPDGTVPQVELVQGTHIVLRDFQTRHCYYLENPRDGRGIFVMPWYGHSLVGTTETRFQGKPDAVRPLDTEIRYLRKALRHFFPQSVQAIDGAAEAFTGLRVLPAGGGHAFNRSRETRLVVDRAQDPRVLTILGGKLTAYRATACKVLDRIGHGLPQRKVRADTATLPLVPPEDADPDAF
jgi:glycerol-3-phosphate dehydrogenase